MCVYRNIITIYAQDNTGAYYAIQSLVSLAEFQLDGSSLSVPSGVIEVGYKDSIFLFQNYDNSVI